jgi:predicted phosphoribosyltransferase
MPETNAPTRETVVELLTGTLTLRGADPARLAQLCDFAARANPRRGFLIVSRVLGRHLPTRPGDFRASVAALAAKLPAGLPGPVVFLGMAETATALAQGVWAAWRALHPDAASVYLQTSRQRAQAAAIIARFEEGHSHATSHMIQIADSALAEQVRRARTLVIIDDECSTGGTFANAAQAMAEAMPALQAIHCLSLTDWSGGAFLERMPAPARAHALIAGAMEWQPAARQFEAVLANSANRRGTAPETGMRSRTGLRAPEAAIRPALTISPGERVLVLGDGEHSYEAMRVAEEIERSGGIAAIQSITRTPALIGHAIGSVALLTDAYGSGATCHLYNALAHQPARIVIAAEIAGDQACELERALAQTGAEIRVELLACHYREQP